MSIDAMKQALALICSARLCEVNSMSSREEMLRLMSKAADTLRAAIEQAEKPRRWQRLTEEEIARRESVKPILVRIMQEAYDLADRDDSEGYNSVKVMCSEVLGMINELLDEHQWQGLTDKELAEFSDLKLGAYDLCLEVEAKLREKNT